MKPCKTLKTLHSPLRTNLKAVLKLEKHVHDLAKKTLNLLRNSSTLFCKDARALGAALAFGFSELLRRLAKGTVPLLVLLG